MWATGPPNEVRPSRSAAAKTSPTEPDAACCATRSGDPHPQEFRDAVEPEEGPDQQRHGPLFRVDEQLWLDEADLMAPDADPALPGREDVLHPVDVRAIGQREHVRVAAPEDVHRGPVGLAALAALVDQEPERWQPGREPSRDRVEDMGRERPQEPHPGPGRWC